MEYLNNKTPRYSLPNIKSNALPSKIDPYSTRNSSLSVRGKRIRGYPEPETEENVTSLNTSRRLSSERSLNKIPIDFVNGFLNHNLTNITSADRSSGNASYQLPGVSMQVRDDCNIPFNNASKESVSSLGRINFKQEKGSVLSTNEWYPEKSDLISDNKMVSVANSSNSDLCSLFYRH